MSVIELAKHRKPKKQIEEVAHYSCMRCYGLKFRLYADGTVFCWDCGAKMSNLTAIYEPSDHIS